MDSVCSCFSQSRLRFEVVFSMELMFLAVPCPQVVSKARDAEVKRHRQVAAEHEREVKALMKDIEAAKVSQLGNCK